ncbi:MAG: DUF2384 domain-containing protein [Roseibium sp.]|nr:DUF2384 domain-containing protein [Roseibium sp.]
MTGRTHEMTGRGGTGTNIHFWNTAAAIGRRLDALMTLDRMPVWFCTPNPELDDRTPAELIADKDLDALFDLLERMEGQAANRPSGFGSILQRLTQMGPQALDMFSRKRF